MVMADRITMRTLLAEMAYTRDQFVNKLVSLLHGARGEFYKSKVAEKNGLATDRHHGDLVEVWAAETVSLLRASRHTFGRKLRGFKNVEKAIDEAFEESRGSDAVDRREASSMVHAIFKKKLRMYVDDADLLEFETLAR